MPNPVSRGSPQTRRRVLLLATSLILLFSRAEYLALGHVSWPALGLRLLWALVLLAGGLAFGRLGPAAERNLVVALGLATVACRTALLALTGGEQAPASLHWLMAMPVIMALVVQDHPEGTLSCAAATLASGLWLLARAGRPGPELGIWAAQCTGVGALAVYATASYQALRRREARAAAEREEALARALLLDGERQARQAAEAELQARDEFLTVASHELKTPLAALRLQAQAARRGLPPASAPPEVARRLEGLEQHVDRLARLVDTLLDVSRIRLGRLALELEEVDLTALVREVAARHTGPLAQAGSTLEVRAAPGVVGRWDRVRLEQVLTNLLSNATRYGAGRPVLLTLESGAGQAQLTVADQGIGVAPEDAQRIFRRFERGVPSRQYGGLGLGLWITEQIVSALGGEISLESAPGQGSTFRIRLPLAPAAPRAAGIDLH